MDGEQRHCDWLKKKRIPSLLSEMPFEASQCED